jgi:hypothetical protein
VSVAISGWVPGARRPQTRTPSGSSRVPAVGGGRIIGLIVFLAVTILSGGSGVDRFAGQL